MYTEIFIGGSSTSKEWIDASVSPLANSHGPVHSFYSPKSFFHYLAKMDYLAD